MITKENFTPKPFLTNEVRFEGFPNITGVNGDGTKSFIEITSRTRPTPDNPKHGHIRQELWVEAPNGQEISWQVMGLAALATMQFAEEHPERDVHLVRYYYRPVGVVV